MSEWQHARGFIELALSLEKYVPGYFDFYYGPEEVRTAVESKGKLPLGALSDQADGMLESTRADQTLTAARRIYLCAELGAMQTTLRILQGEKMSYVEETRGLYGLTPRWTDERVFEEAHRTLEELYTGSGSLAERRAQFLEKTVIPPDKIEAVIQECAEDFRSRTRAIIDLPEEETCDFTLVQDQPWSAYNWYLGGYTSRIDLNIDLPVYAGLIPHLIAHESYPGHHTEFTVKEQDLFREKGWLEHSILLTNTPSCVPSEGIAENALEMITTPIEHEDCLQRILDRAGLKEVNGTQILHVMNARRALGKLGINRALMLHVEGATDQEVIDYGVRYGLLSEEQSRKGIEFLKDPLWRAYIPLYALGYELVKAYLGEGEEKVERFRKLIREPITTTQLEA